MTDKVIVRGKEGDKLLSCNKQERTKGEEDDETKSRNRSESRNRSAFRSHLTQRISYILSLRSKNIDILYRH